MLPTFTILEWRHNEICMQFVKFLMDISDGDWIAIKNNVDSAINAYRTEKNRANKMWKVGCFHGTGETITILTKEKK